MLPGILQRQESRGGGMAVQNSLIQAVQAHQAGRLEEAEKLYRKILSRRPREAIAALNLGIILHGRGALDEAGKLVRRALSIAPSTEGYNNLGNILRDEGKLPEAAAAYRQAIKLQPNANASNNLGNLLWALGDHDGAVASYQEAIRADPDYVLSYYHLGIALRRLGRPPAEAMACYEKAVELRPNFSQALTNLGTCLFDLGRFAEAVERYKQSLALGRPQAETWCNLGNALQRLQDAAGAEAAYREALALQPDSTDALLNLSTLYIETGRRRASIPLLERATQLQPDNSMAWAKLSFEKRHDCDWRDYDESVDGILRRFVRSGPTRITPFSLITLDSTPEEQLINARDNAQRRIPAVTPLPAHPVRPATDGKIRIGYLSADYHPHATAYLMAELFERHDRSRFDIAAYSIGPDSDSEIRRRLVAGFDRFVDLSRLSHADAARRIHDDRVDILIDLKGYTQNARTEIMSWRPGAVQVQYLGYPATMGAAFIDYIIADSFIIPPQHHAHFDEKVVTLPHCYQPNDTLRPIAPEAPTRAECGLPENGFVFCSFNMPYKLTPRIFAIWMRLLAQVPDSVLWLLEVSPVAAENLRQAAQQHGIDPARIVFAPALHLPMHLARQKNADLFLDTLPVNAHTTASDALWAGLPVLTCAGDTFISRVAGSLLHAIGLPELVTYSLEDYETLALSLARDPQRLGRIRQHIAQHRLTAPLFDIARYTRNLEQAYQLIWERHLSGQPPAAIEVPDQGGA